MVVMMMMVMLMEFPLGPGIPGLPCDPTPPSRPFARFRHFRLPDPRQEPAKGSEHQFKKTIRRGWPKTAFRRKPLKKRRGLGRQMKIVSHS